MATHLREILKQNPKQVEEALEDHSVCVYLQQTRKHDDGQTSFRTYFACCLGCGQHSHTTKHAFRFLHEQWCEKCRAPFNGTCDGCLKHSTRKQYTETNKCDEFIRKHEASCGGKWDDVAPWFNLKVAAPKLKIAARKTERKMVRKTLAAPKAKAVAAAPVAAPAETTPTLTCDVMAKLFDVVFDHYYDEIDDPDYDAEEHLEDYQEQRKLTLYEMAKKASKSYNTQRNQILREQIAKKNNQKIIDLAVCKAVQEVEADVVKEHEKVLRLQQQLEEAQSEARRNIKQVNEQRSQITKMIELLKSNNIEYNPYD
jgi:hypothetical protein